MQISCIWGLLTGINIYFNWHMLLFAFAKRCDPIARYLYLTKRKEMCSGAVKSSCHLSCVSGGGTKERPWSAILSPEEHSSFTLPPPRRATTIMAFHGNNLSKSLSISNIAGWAAASVFFVFLIQIKAFCSQLNISEASAFFFSLKPLPVCVIMTCSFMLNLFFFFLSDQSGVWGDAD